MKEEELKDYRMLVTNNFIVWVKWRGEDRGELLKQLLEDLKGPSGESPS